MWWLVEKYVSVRGIQSSDFRTSFPSQTPQPVSFSDLVRIHVIGRRSRYPTYARLRGKSKQHGMIFQRHTSLRAVISLAMVVELMYGLSISVYEKKHKTD